MDPWIIWLVLGVALGVGEVLSLSLFLAPFAIGGFGASIVAATGAGPVPQVAVFALLTAVGLLLFRPIARRHLHQPPSTRTGTAALVGRTAVVVAALTGPEHDGQVRLEGEVWTAQSAGLTDVPVGTTVTVLEIRGATVIVTD